MTWALLSRGGRASSEPKAVAFTDITFTCAFITGFLLVYQLFMSPVSVTGCLQDLFHARRSW